MLLIAEDRAALRVLRLALRQAADLTLVAAVDGRHSVEASLRAHAPDVVVVDEMCQRTNSLARIGEVNREAPGAQVVFFTRTLDDGALAEAFEAGADAAIYRRMPPATLAVLLHEVVHGRVVHSPRASRVPDRPGTPLRPVRDHDVPRARTIA